MENVDMFNNATAQLTFHNFLGRMRHPSAADLVRSIKNFISAFMSHPPEPERDSQSVQEFLTNTEDAFKAHPLWAGATEEEFESSGEGLEKYLMTKLFTRAFAPIPEDAEQDQRLSEKMSILQRFIRPEHLDISESFQNETSWLLAQKELQKINTYKAPRDKVVCILNCCRVINNLLLNVSNKDNPPGADDFLPVLIYVVIKTNPPQLHSNLQYIQRYRHHSRLVSEASYFYTNLVSAESFIDNLNSSSLTMDPAEFEERMKAGRGEVQAANVIVPAAVVESQTSSSLKEMTSKMHNRLKDAIMGEYATGDSNRAGAGKGEKPVQPTTAVPAVATPAPAVAAPEETGSGTDGKVLSVEKLEAQAFGQVLEADKNGQLAKDYPFLYASAGDLRVMDVESLLHEYKELVLRYVALRKGVEGSVRTDEPQVSITLDSKQEHGAADTLDSARETPVESESLAQVLTRPEDTAELFLEETANLHSEPSLVPDLQPRYGDVSRDDSHRKNENSDESDESRPKGESAERSSADENAEGPTDEGEAEYTARATGSPKEPASSHSIEMASRSEEPSPPDTDSSIT